MAISERLKEERQRLGLTQTAFAELAGVTKSAQIKWEGGASSAPTAPALAAWAEAGVDVLYVLTGRRTAADQSDQALDVAEYIAAIRRDMLVSAWEGLDGEDDEAAETRVLSLRARHLQQMMQGRAGPLTNEQQEEVETLLNIITSPVQLAAFRTADRIQHYSRRRKLRERLALHTELGDFHPSEAAIDTMTTLALDHGAPIDLLSRLFYEIVVGDDDPGWPEEGSEKAPA